MRRIKKCTVFLLLLCLLLNLAGCAAAQKPLRVTLVLKTVTEVAEFWGTLLSGVEKAAEEYGVQFYYQDFRPMFRDGQARARELGFYTQKYCGCVFSEQERYQKPSRIIP